MNRIIFPILLLLSGLTARAQTTNVVALVTFTNVVRGVTNGDTITVNGDVRRYTNGALASTAFILSTNIVGHVATNTWLRLAVYTPAFVDRIFTTNTNSLVIQGKLLSSLTVSLSSGVGTVAYSTQVWSTVYPIVGPNGGIPTEAGRTNNASQLIALLNDNRSTNILANGNPALTNLLDLTSQQRGSNKVFWATTNYGGLSDGRRLTNIASLSGSNGTLADVNLQRGSLLNVTNISGTNALFTNVFLQHVTFKDARITGTNIGVTNGFLVNVTNVNPMTSNLVNYGNAIRSEGTGGNSFQAGSNAVASGDFSVALGNSAVASNSYALALGTGAIATNISSIAVGNSASAGGNYATAIGIGASAVGESVTSIGNGAGSGVTGASSTVNLGVESTAWSTGDIAIGQESTTGTSSGGSIAIGFPAVAYGSNAIAIGRQSSAGYHNSIAIGGGAATTQSNEVMLGTSSYSVAVPGTLKAAAVQSLVTQNTNILGGDLSFPRADISTVAAGHNVIDVGTNVYLRLTGGPGGDWTLGGITSGSIRDGKVIIVENRTGYSVTIQNESGTTPTAAERILTLASSGSVTNATLVGDGTMMFIYNGASARWVLIKPDVDVSASATNAIGTISTNGVILGANLTAVSWTTGVTGYLSGATAMLGVNASGGGSAGTNTAGLDMELAATSGTTSAWVDRSAPRGWPSGVTNLVVAGDSRATTTGGTTNWVGILTNRVTTFRLTTNASISGQKAWTIMTNYQQAIGQFAPGASSNALLVIDAGINDLAQGSNATQVLFYLSTIMTNANSNGFKIMLATVAPSGATTHLLQESNRVWVNAILRTNQQWHYLVDFDGFVPHALPWFNSDMLHQADEGKALMAECVVQTLNGGLRNPRATVPVSASSGPFKWSGMRDTNAVKSIRHSHMFSSAGTFGVGYENTDGSLWSHTFAGGVATWYGTTTGDGTIDVGDIFRIDDAPNARTVFPKTVIASNTVAATSFVLNTTNIVAAPAGLSLTGAHLWSDGTNLCVVFQNTAGTRTTNKLSMTAWP